MMMYAPFVLTIKDPISGERYEVLECHSDKIFLNFELATDNDVVVFLKRRAKVYEMQSEITKKFANIE